MRADESRKSTDAAAIAPVRKSYVKPAFRREVVFETMALACGKVSGTQGSCAGNKKNS